MSNIAFIGKIIEKMAAKHLISHLNDNKLHEKMQSAYRSYHSTETALLRVHNDILVQLDKKRSVLLVLLDLSAAFDTIDHDVLFNLLSTRLGVRGHALDWFISYLSSRTQSVSISGESSSPKILHYGVPQGSVLGPLLYTVYTLPLGDLLHKLGIPYHFYADDSQLYLSFDSGDKESFDNTIVKMEQCVAAVKTWMNSVKLKLNDEKTEVILISSPHFSKQISSLNFKAGNTAVTPALSVRNLGVIFDNTLSMKKHVDTVCKSVSFHLRNIGKVRKYISQTAAELLVHSLVSSRIDYSNSLLFGIPDNQVKRLQRLFHVAARIVTLTPSSHHITPVLYKLHWLPVKQRIAYKVLLVVYKAMNGIGPEYSSDLLIPLISNRQLRSSSQNLFFSP